MAEAMGERVQVFSWAGSIFEGIYSVGREKKSDKINTNIG